MTAPQPVDTNAALRQRLDALLSETVAAAVERERRAFDERAAPFEKRLVLCGAGGFGRYTLKGLRRAGLEPLAFTDNNARLWGQKVDGVDVFSPAESAAKFGADAAFVGTVWNGTAKDRVADRISQLMGLGCSRVIPAAFLFWKFPDIFLPHYPLDLPHNVLLHTEEIRSVFDLWHDDCSREEYVAQIAFRLWLEFDGLGLPDPQHYFPAGLFQLSPDEVLIDCGAFDGDTIGAFVQRMGESFRQVIAYEPDPANWEKLERAVSLLPDGIRPKIDCRFQAVGSRAETVSFSATGTDLSSVGAGDLSVKCVTLDEDLQLAPTFIKFDIEGFELEALRGGARTIAANRPLLAVSAYHQQSHLWDIPLAIQALTAGYRYFLRPHGSEAWDLVCYAVPSERLVSARRTP